MTEAVFSEHPIREWDQKKALIEIEMNSRENRDQIALFFETLSQKKDANYKVNKTRFENIANLVEFLIQTCENMDDLANAAVLLFYTQYFCFESPEEGRHIFLAERLQELSLVKNPEFWEKAMAAMVYVWLPHAGSITSDKEH